MPPNRPSTRGRRTSAAMAGYHTMMNYPPNRGAAILSIVISILIWAGVCVGIWFLTKMQCQDKIFYNAALHSFDLQTVNSFALMRTIILGIIELIFMIIAMVEYLFKFHAISGARGMRDNYKWYVCPVWVCVSALVVFPIFNHWLLALGWITLVQLVGLLLVVFIPRLCFPPT